MTKLKKKLNILFHKIFLKLYSSMKNVTSEPMSLDLLREEVQILISTMIFIEFKLILNHSHYYYSKKMDTSLLLENSNEWIIKKIQVEEYSSIIDLLHSIYSVRLGENFSANLTASLIENLGIKLSNFMVYEIFSSKNFSKFIFLKWYTVDYLLFSYSLINLKTYLYWKSYVESIYSTIKRFSTDTYPLLICTKNGIESKRLYNRSLIYNTNSSKIQTIFSKSLNFLEYLIYEIKIGM